MDLKIWRYGRNEWRCLSSRYRKAHPLCRRCGAKAEHVDHIIDIRTAPERRRDWWNLQSLCHACHNEKTAADKGGRSMRPHGGCDADGMPTDPRHPWNATQSGTTGGRGGVLQPRGASGHERRTAKREFPHG